MKSAGRLDGTLLVDKLREAVRPLRDPEESRPPKAVEHFLALVGRPEGIDGILAGEQERHVHDLELGVESHHLRHGRGDDLDVVGPQGLQFLLVAVEHGGGVKLHVEDAGFVKEFLELHGCLPLGRQVGDDVGELDFDLLGVGDAPVQEKRGGQKHDGNDESGFSDGDPFHEQPPSWVLMVLVQDLTSLPSLPYVPAVKGGASILGFRSAFGGRGWVLAQA